MIMSKLIKESGSKPALAGGMIGSDGPRLKPGNTHHLSDYSGQFHGNADTVFGGNMGLSKLFPTDYFDELEKDSDDEDLILQEFVDLGLIGSGISDFFKKNIGKIFNIGQAAAYSIPVFGDLGAALKFLYSYFGPYGLRSSVKKFTRKFSKLTGVNLGNDFLEPEGLPDINDEEFNAKINYATHKLLNLENYPEIKSKLTPEKIEELVDGYDAILDSIRSSFIAFFGAADFFVGQKGFFINTLLSVVEPEDFADWLVNKYSEVYLKKIKKIFPDNNSLMEFFKKIAGVLRIPLDTLGHFDLLINPDKLERVYLIHRSLRSLREEEDVILSTLGKEEGDVNKVLRFVLDKVFEGNSKNSGLLLEVMDDYLSDDEIEDDEIEEYSSAGSISGYSLPVGKSNKSPSSTKDHIRFSEQIEYMRKLQDYHTKTTQKMK
jgi:hypothetical protein